MAERRGLSLQYRLPLLITALVLVAVAAGMLGAWFEVQRASVDSARTRLELVSRELVRVVTPGIQSQLDSLHAVAAAPAISAALLGSPDTAAVLAELRRLAVPTEPEAQIVLLDAQRRVVFRSPSPSDPGSLPLDQLPTEGYGSFLVTDAGAQYWIATPVIGDDGPLGFVAQLRTVSSTDGENPVQTLLGEDAELILANGARGGPWITLGGQVVEVPAEWPFDGGRSYRSSEGEFFVHATPLPQTPWYMVARAGSDLIFARADSFARRSALAVVLLGIFGAIGAWILSAWITRPIRSLQRASEAMARGNYQERIEVDRSDELGALAESFNRMADRVKAAHTELLDQYETANALAGELDRASRAKSEFLATMSHEIRTPINAIVGYTDVLLLGIHGPLTDLQREHLERVRVSGRHLTHLVDQVLDLARVESGTLAVDTTPSAAAESVGTMLTLLRPQAEEKRIALQVTSEPCDLWYRGDPRRVDQILVNLASNAIKFTDPGGRVSIACERREGKLPFDGREGVWTCLTITDNGLGIPAEELDRIFGAFVQLDAGYTRRHGGAGLGLAISLRLARSMGGDISVESTVGSGSMFTLWLPAAEPDNATGSPPLPATRESHS